MALTLNKDRFLKLLGELISFTDQLQNSPDAGLVPREKLAADVVLKTLKPHIESGALSVEILAGEGYADRPSLMITLPGREKGPPIGLVGAHFDVVPADREAEGWERDPFKLWVGDDGTLYGRGVTDCLGHVALLSDLLAQLCEQNLKPRRELKVVLIANEEEAPVPHLGLDYVVDQGHMDDLKDGTIYWLDSADFGPTVGTGGVAMWELEVEGVTGHSGLTQNCVNALELGMAASRALVDWFEAKYAPHPDEERWGFLSPSTLKATVIHVENNKITKIPGHALIEGDFRLTPFYDVKEAMSGATALIDGLDAEIRKGVRPDGFPRIQTESGRTGSLKLRAKGRFMEGIACDLNSPGLRALERAIGEACASPAKRFSMTGSLPLVRDLQRRGFDVQITGFGRSTYYHAPNEQAELAHFEQGFVILRELLELA